MPRDLRPNSPLSPFACLRGSVRSLGAAVSIAVALASSTGASAQSGELLSKLNAPWGRVSESARSANRLFTAYLDMTKPPQEIGEEFNLTAIYPGMDGWEAVAAWAEANGSMGQTLIGLQDCLVLGVPYGTEGVDPRFVERGLVALIGVEGDLTRVDFPYLKALEAINAYVAADLYRLCEAGKFEDAFKIGVAHLRVLRQACDAMMFDEKYAAMNMLADAMSVHRDAIYAYRDKLGLELVRKLAMTEYPFLKATDNERLRRIAMPEGDLFVAQELIESVFGDLGQVKEEEFAKIFSGMQAREAPLTGFGAVKRWERVAGVHGSLDASDLKLTSIYDDWWRRWRMRPYDAMMSLPTELSVVNPVKYAAVVYAARDIESLFVLRRRLVTEFCGLVAGTGLVGYREQFDDWPRDIKMSYTQFFPKRFDFDPYDPEYGSMRYEYLGTRMKGIDSEFGRLEVSGCLLYARNDNNGFDEPARHLPGGKLGDFFVWPPLRAVSRGQGD
jgi:hypothetical protein